MAHNKKLVSPGCKLFKVGLENIKVTFPHVSKHGQYLGATSSVKKAKSGYDKKYARADSRIHFVCANITSCDKSVENMRMPLFI
jgi:hypothetical protein